MLNANPDHLRLRSENRDHLHDFENELRVVALLVAPHNGLNLAVDDMVAHSLGVLVFHCRLLRNSVRCLLGNEFGDQIYSQSRVSKLLVQGISFGVTFENWPIKLFYKNLHAWLAQLD